MADRLDQAVGGADLRVARPRWWSVVGALQRLLAAAVAAGMVWLLALAILGYLRIDDVIPTPELGGIPAPTWLLLGGAFAGVALAYLARIVNGVGARRRSRAAARELRREVDRVAQDLVIAPVERELEAHERLRSSLATSQ